MKSLKDISLEQNVRDGPQTRSVGKGVPGKKGKGLAKKSSKRKSTDKENDVSHNKKSKKQSDISNPQLNTLLCEFMKHTEQLNSVQQSQTYLNLPGTSGSISVTPNVNGGGDENEGFDIDSVSYHEDNDNFDMFSHQNEAEIIFDNENAEFSMPKVFEDETKFCNLISEVMANFVKSGCTKKADISKYVEEIKIPENCKNIVPPLINSEIWNNLYPNIQQRDRTLRGSDNSWIINRTND